MPVQVPVTCCINKSIKLPTTISGAAKYTNNHANASTVKRGSGKRCPAMVCVAVRQRNRFSMIRGLSMCTGFYK